jgi:protein-S-isoprenylcysteine O-methyltransferase Ste14
MKRAPTFLNIVSVAGIGVVIYVFVRPPWSAPRVAGLILMLAALVPLIVARMQLGSSFSLTPQARQLVTHGIYSRIRNPIYVFSTFLLIGLFLFLDKPYLFLFLLPLVVMQFFRARAEARLLEQHFGEQYRQYKAGTWF